MINSKTINDCLKLNFKNKVEFGYLDLIDSKKNNVLSFIYQEEFINKLNSNKRIRGVFVNKSLAGKIKSKDIIKIVCDDARYCFFSLYNYLAKRNYVKFKSRIDKTAKVDKRAVISGHNVVIGKNVVIEPNVIIYPDVYIGNNCMIKAGAALGCDGYELKRTKHAMLSVIHDGRLIIKDNVYVGNNTTIYKGFSLQDTIIGENSKIDNLVYIAHSVVIGNGCFVVGNSMISGSTTIGDNVWVGPGAIISNKVSIQKGAQITVGAIVTKNVDENNQVSGNFAIDHKKFIKFIKSIR
ncbi:MAG: UDP-3-O-(3-hydroxymyristoyl)glucosamine N-acyltransferase [Ignavibacteria bacterium]